VRYINTFYFTNAHINLLGPDSTPNIPALSQINGDTKNLIDSGSYECNDQNVLSELFSRLTVDGFKNSNNGMNGKTNDASIEHSTEYIDKCKNQSLMRSFQSGFNNTDKNSDIAKACLIKNIEHVKRQSEIRNNKNVCTRLLDEKKLQSSSISVSMKYKMYIISWSKYNIDIIFFLKYTFLI